MRAEVKETLWTMLRAGALGGAFGLVGTLMVAYTFDLTKDDIAENERRVLVRTLNQVVPPGEYDNDLFSDTIRARNEEMLGTDEAVAIYRARKEGEPVAALLTTVAPDGYSGDIRLLVGVEYSGRLAGVRVLGHKETPGLGDLVEKSKSDWITQFDGASLAQPPLPQWKVERDGGAFDQVTGATITPRAIVSAVKKALLFYNGHREKIFSLSTGEVIMPESDQQGTAE